MSHPPNRVSSGLVPSSKRKRATSADLNAHNRPRRPEPRPELAAPATSQSLAHTRQRAPCGALQRSHRLRRTEASAGGVVVERSLLAAKSSPFSAGAGGGHNRSILVLVNDGSAGSRDREATCHVEHAVSRIQRMIDPRSRAPARSLHGGKRGSGSGRRFGQEPRSPRKIPW